MLLLLQPQRSWLQNRCWFLNTHEWSVCWGTHHTLTLPYLTKVGLTVKGTQTKSTNIHLKQKTILIWHQIYPKKYLSRFQIDPQKLTATPVLDIEHPSPSHLKPTSIPWVDGQLKKNKTNNPQTSTHPPTHPKLGTALAITNLKYFCNVISL